MAATDTIVGITGAVLLAVVMVGVFVYEYNNAPADAADPLAGFRGDYPTLNATGDLDGDRIANHQDPDMDGDGTANVDDTATAVTRGFTATMPAPSPPAQTAPPIEFKVRVEAGNVGAAFTLYYNSTTVSPLPGLPTLNLEVLGNDATGSSPVRAQAQGSGAVTVTITTEDLAPGEYTLRVTQGQAGPSTPFAVKAFLDYGAGRPSDGPGFVKS